MREVCALTCPIQNRCAEIIRGSDNQKTTTYQQGFDLIEGLSALTNPDSLAKLESIETTYPSLWGRIAVGDLKNIKAKIPGTGNLAVTSAEGSDFVANEAERIAVLSSNSCDGPVTKRRFGFFGRQIIKCTSPTAKSDASFLNLVPRSK